MRRHLRGFPALLAAAMLVAVLIAVPILSVTANLLLAGSGDTWSHLASTVLPDYILNTLILCVGVGFGVIVVGVSTAWLVSIHDFPGRRMFEWALVLPLAVPAYVMAYAYTDLLQFVGPVQTWLRETFELSPGQYWFPDIRTVGGACAVFVFVLYPYVYLLARAAFLERASGMLEAGRSLGLGPWANFFRVSLPLARPAIAAGAALALMETLADFGAVTYFGVPTFTSGIYRAWFSLGDRVAAAQLAALLLGFVAMVLFIERLSRGRARFHNTTGRNRPMPGYRLRGMKAAGAVLVCLLPLALGLGIAIGGLAGFPLPRFGRTVGEGPIESLAVEPFENLTGDSEQVYLRAKSGTTATIVSRVLRTWGAAESAVAEMLADHPAAAAVHYPGLPTHPGHAVAARQMSGFGGMVSFQLAAGEGAALEVCRSTQVFTLAESLGAVESLIEHPGRMTHASVAGSSNEVPGDLVRLSVGIEDVEDLLGDLGQALDALEGLR